MLLRHHLNSLLVYAPAKLNFFLEVLGKRSDGFHELETLMVTLGIYDTLIFTEETSGQTRLNCLDAGMRCHASRAAGSETIPSGRKNLVVQAAELLREASGVDCGVRIVLGKRIPVAAGLAGGSSNAAATLLALNHLWNLKWPRERLQTLASELGSDVPFFLASVPAAICRGRGEHVQPISLPLDLHVVVVRPHSGLSTADVYRHCRPSASPKSVSGLVDCLQSGRLGFLPSYLHNALQPAAESLNPEVVDLKNRFSEIPVLGHQMSGSGTAYFGVCTTKRQASAMAARLRLERVGQVFVAQCRP